MILVSWWNIFCSGSVPLKVDFFFFFLYRNIRKSSGSEQSAQKLDTHCLLWHADIINYWDFFTVDYLTIFPVTSCSVLVLFGVSYSLYKEGTCAFRQREKKMTVGKIRLI